MKKIMTAVLTLLLVGCTASATASEEAPTHTEVGGAAYVSVVEVPRPSGGTVECAVVHAGWKHNTGGGIDCNWDEEEA